LTVCSAFRGAAGQTNVIIANTALYTFLYTLQVDSLMDLIDRKVDEIWSKVSAISPQLMSDWIECFSGSYIERKEKSKLEIKKSLTEREYQSDPRKNFIWRLMSSEHGYRGRNNVRKKRSDLAMLFLRVMTENSYWQDYFVATWSLIPVGEMEHRPESGLVTSLSSRDENVAYATELSSSALYQAARLEDDELVAKLIKDAESGKVMQPNEHGYTSLHAAAKAVRPNAKIAKLLVTSVKPNERERFLNAQTDSQWGQNTALHIAVANDNVTAAFIQEIKETDSRQRNAMKDTPFHVAAKSRNPEAIIHMLNTFAPTNNRWDVDDVDAGHDDTVINICARNGNAKAVELLIKHGADISKGVLHEIVIESVRNPEKIGKLLGVYQSIVDNAVTWYCLERDILTFKSSDDYMVYFRKIMVWLLTRPLDKYGKKDVLQCALDHGASAMFWRIINTKSVFRSDGDEARRLIAGNNPDGLENERKENPRVGNQWKWTVFDVTNFTERTFLKASRRDVSEKNRLLSKKRQVDDEKRQHTVERAVDTNNVQTECERNFDEPETPHEPYLTSLLTAFDPWRSSNILCSQPIKELTGPYVKLAQRFCFILGLLQFIFMCVFTFRHMPTKCTPLLMFNRSTIFCNRSSDHAVPIEQQRSLTAVFWLIWPIVLFTMNVYIILQSIKHLSSRQHADKIVFRSKELNRLRPWRHFIQTLLRNALSIIFCVTVFLWLCIYFIGETYESYVEVTAMVLMFGWTANLDFFGSVMKDFSIFSLVVTKIIMKDIPSFMLYFGFTVVGYSFAMHALRMLSCTPNEFMDETFFSVLSSAFGIGDFFDVTMTDTTCASANVNYLFEFVYFSYICAAMILLLNTLIAMLSHRYEKAKPRAENVWRFRLLSVMSALKRHTIVERAMKKCGLLDFSVDDVDDNDDDNYCSCNTSCGRINNNDIVYVYDYGNKYSGSLFFNRKIKRYYLQLVLPVDRQLKRL